MSTTRVPHTNPLEEYVLIGNQTGLSVPVPDWLPDCYKTFHERLVDKKYPCYLGSVAENQGDIRYTYIHGEDREHLPQTLETFVNFVLADMSRRRVLALFYKPEDEAKPHKYYESKFWDLLEFLHQHDPQPWPDGHPTDAADPYWEFAFGGLTMFVFGVAPTYKLRNSRNLGDGMLVLFQPRNVFDGIEGDTAEGARARKIIRNRLHVWDAVAPHPHLGSYGHDSNLEWKQYFLPDDDSQIMGECPFKHKDNRQETGRD
jgi:uncharacterized protein